MNKLVCLFITLVMLLGSGTSLFASIKTDTCAGSFGEFVIDQIQKNFSQTISTIPQKENKNSDNSISLYVISQSLEDNSFNKSANNYKFISGNLKLQGNVLFFSDIWRQHIRHQGLNEYVIKLNSFIAVNAVNDEVSSIILCI
ncbi:MAG: hypothetical protein PHR82_00110 [Endomicrobiaceae bacterium]|nr:hypothetical protein [Endomicrobiaceae bacterium]